MLIQIEPQSDVPIYEQVTRQIIEGIARGDMKPGDTLPSVRNLASDLGVNMHTVNKSYHELEAKGILTIRAKSGAIIRSAEERTVTPEQLQQIEKNLKPLVAEGMVLGATVDQIEFMMKKVFADLQMPAEGV
ncbi:GntR family transcriptional regulator [Lysinibacillus sphaericus]|uniref:GntR family transcriptional regulator n=1 Tax=Lysinibacillus sphaericus OT4b.31 TaxID=1285586 RepID=R7ZJ42_LYSSH|nr:GntR family transcriptional regulator [Lysinibacillus sphaericus]EON74088.1 GntR family transcriptional regulator [Lysinibacillus sphaericus OT4b.31]